MSDELLGDKSKKLDLKHICTKPRRKKLRVIGGTARGKKLLSVPGDTTRPILDRVKTPLFDILRPWLSRKTVLDMFAGSGAVGIEALSQGAEHCTFLDLSKAAVDTIRTNLENTGLGGQAEVRKTDAFSYIKNCQRSFDLVYIAPPQYKGLWIEALQLLAERPDKVNLGGKIIVQIDPKENEGVQLTSFFLEDERRYGNTVLLFFGKR